MELLKDYNYMIEYHPEKANMIADALSQKSSGSLYHIRTVRMSLLNELRKLDTEFKVDTYGGVLATLRVRPILIERILAAQWMDKETKKLCSDVKNWKLKELSCSEEGILKF